MYPEAENNSDQWQALGAVAGGLFGAFVGSELELPGIILGGVVGSFLGVLLLSIGNPAPTPTQSKYRRRKLRPGPAAGARYHELP